MISEEKLDVGTCCACGKQDDTVRNFILLNLKGKDSEPSLDPLYHGGEKMGWGCVICGIWGGAIAVLCDECVRKNVEIKFAIDGYPKDKKRIPIDQLTEPFGHDLRLHPSFANHWSKEVGYA